ncbi:putative major facilitator, sugar transporter, major facilitator superfamily [Medicago truncatula]|uniref:Putative major facilitator, sugar transporter, major facilitator superfamily n=1 Tax=Medicago truncatula TaxID=3880 RepID=A0A396I209_MEDTR|nr:putative major facilitator, sugar transporter, major facilitator superfamily [Medicago truncatula]
MIGMSAIVSTLLAGAVIGAAVGGWINDRFGRKRSIMIADTLFFIGSAIMAAATSPAILIVGRVFVGLGVGMASMASPLYISEASPAKVRGALAPGTWRWMLGVAALPAILQLLLMFWLPESPRWLFRKGKEEEGKAILRKIYPAEEVDAEIQAL